MKKDIFITGLDIGSSKTAAVTARFGRGAFEIIGWMSQASRGVSQGMLVDLDEAVDSVSTVLSKLREKTSGRTGQIYVNISGQSIKGARSVGMVPLALRGREVVKPDIDRCIGVASTIHLPFDREIIHRIVHNFSIDDQPWIRNPLGLYASRLSCEAYIVTADANHIQSIYKCVNSAGHDVHELVFTGIADGFSLLDKQQKEQGVVLIDMGNSLTVISIFQTGELADLMTIPTGLKGSSIDLKGDAGLGAVVNTAADRIRDFVKAGGMIAGVVLTGGAAFQDGLIEFMEERLPYPVKMGAVQDARGDISGIEAMRLTTAIGLAKYGYEKHRREAEENNNAVRRLSYKVIDMFNQYF